MTNRILITGALGQLGTVLSNALHKVENNYVLATDIRNTTQKLPYDFAQVDVLDYSSMEQIIVSNKINCIYHLVATLSATGEQAPFIAWDLNMQSFQHIAKLSVNHNIHRVFWPSSIAAYGEDKNSSFAPQNADMNPTTIYGVSKLAGEKLMNYYYIKYGLDIRSIRLPGVLSLDPPGGGTTDYVVEMVHAARDGKPYTCFLKPDTELPMIYIKDMVQAVMQLMSAPRISLHRTFSYNVMGFSLTPQILAMALHKKGHPFQLDYAPDYRQKIAASWPKSLDDRLARSAWGWKPKYNLEDCLTDMLG